MTVDLHLHTIASDGTMTPTELVAMAAKQGLSAIAITDHDTFAGISEGRAAAKAQRLEFIPGVELSAYFRGEDVHVLGYFVDEHDQLLNTKLKQLRESRELRAHRIVEKLSTAGVNLPWAAVENVAQGDALGRPHVAHALVQQGVVQTISEAFERYLGRDGPAYVPKFVLDLEDIFDVVHGAGGIASLAHPAHWGVGIETITTLKDRGLDAVEVWHIDHTPDDVEGYLEIARKLGLLITGGSDCHGLRKKQGVVLGTLDIPDDIVGPLFERAKEIRAGRQDH